MANSIADLTKQVDALQTSLDLEQDQIKAALQQLQDTIDQLNADNGTIEDRQALADKLTAIKSDLQATVPPSGDEETEPNQPSE